MPGYTPEYAGAYSTAEKGNNVITQSHIISVVYAYKLIRERDAKKDGKETL